MGKTVYFEQKGITEAHDVAMRGLGKARDAYNAFETTMRELNDPRHPTTRTLTPGEVFSKKMAAMTAAEAAIDDAIGGHEEAKRKLFGLARSLEPDAVCGRSRYTATLSSGTQTEHETNLIAERMTRDSEHARRAATIKYESDFRAELDHIEDVAKQQGIETGPALALLRDLKQHARQLKMPLSTMAAISSVQERLFNHYGEHGELVDRLQEAGRAHDTMRQLRGSIRGVKTITARMETNPFLQAQKTAG